MSRLHHKCFAAWFWALAIALPVATAQQPLGNTGVFQLHRADMPPGAVGQGQLLRGGPLAGYFQPVSLAVAGSGRVAIWSGEHFEALAGRPPLVGLQIGQVYRLRVTQIERHPGAELYPTVELVSRLFPPPGLALKFPVPIVFSQEELEMALRGHFVTRVVYLENPNEALPVQDKKGQQRVFEVGQGEDPLQTADLLGRPVAIVRIGSRVPTRDELNPFGYGAPAYRRFELPVEGRDGRRLSRGVEQAVERSARIPRLPVGAPQSAPTRR